jgi:hypothetical protein
LQGHVGCAPRTSLIRLVRSEKEEGAHSAPYEAETWIDPIVAEVRKAREEIAASFDYDLEKMFQGLKESERQRGDRVVSLQPKLYTEKKVRTAHPTEADEESDRRGSAMLRPAIMKATPCAIG